MVRIIVLKGDITRVEADAIVNAANTSLLGGGGVDGAIHRAAGPEVLDECRDIRNRQGGCPVGDAVMTNPGRLKAKVIIHTVGPRWNGGRSNEPELLASCYRNSLSLAENNDMRSIAFPNIGTGIYGYPRDLAVQVVSKVISEFNFDRVQKVLFVCYDDDNYSLYRDRFVKK